MFAYYNANPKDNDVTDCFIRSLSCATGKSWDNVYNYISDLAQKKGTMMDNRDFIIDYLDSQYERVYVGNETVGEVSYNYRNHIVLITMNGHICCSKYGIIYDTFDPRERKAEYCWLVS